MRKVILKTFLFVILVPGSVVAVIPYYLQSSYGKFYLSRYGLGGPIFVLAGIFVCIRCILDFAFIGHGTPAPIDPPKKLVTRGFYRIVRNPMYIGIGGILLGESIMLGSLILFCYTLTFSILTHLFIVFYEEPTLRKKFGASYEEYYRSIPRWIPKIRRARKVTSR